MSTALSFIPSQKPPQQLTLVGHEAPKFNYAFIEHRMREHKLWQNRVTEELTREIICEIEDAVKVWTGRGPQPIVRAK